MPEFMYLLADNLGPSGALAITAIALAIMALGIRELRK